MWLKLIQNPILFQGRNKHDAYFEGWYFKQVSEDLKTIISIIPGVSLDKRDPHCFIQLIANRSSGGAENPPLMTESFRFPLEAFKYRDEPFSIQIGENTFSKDGLCVSLEGKEIRIKGQINFGPFREINTTVINPNIMGFFAYIPKMECNHGIVSMTHWLKGALDLNEEIISFDHGKGYIEKDWGISFPKSYLWLHSNNFQGSDASFMCSVANIPFLGGSFKGIICNLCLGDKEYRFATYNGTRLELTDFSNSHTKLILRRKNLVLKMEARMELGGLLNSPHLGSMSHQIKEGIFGEVDITLENSHGDIIFHGISSQCGIELMPEGAAKRKDF